MFQNKRNSNHLSWWPFRRASGVSARKWPNKSDEVYLKRFKLFQRLQAIACSQEQYRPRVCSPMEFRLAGLRFVEIRENPTNCTPFSIEHLERPFTYRLFYLNSFVVAQASLAGLALANFFNFIYFKSSYLTMWRLYWEYYWVTELIFYWVDITELLAAGSM